MAFSIKPELSPKPNKDGTHTIMLRLCLERKYKRVTLPIRILKKEFNQNGSLAKANWIRGAADQSVFFNMLIKERINSFLKKVEKIAIQDKPVTFDEILKEKEINCYIAHFQTEIDRLEKSNRLEKKYTFELLKQRVVKFNKGSEFLPFEKITIGWAKDFIIDMSNSLSLNSLIQFRGYYSYVFESAMDEGLFIGRNPFKKIKIKRPKTTRIRLTGEEIVKIGEVKLKPGSKSEVARDCFLVQFYCHGMRVGDVITMKASSITRNKEGVMLLSYKMNKTEAVTYGIEVSPVAAKIIEKYLPGKKRDDFIFPWLDNSIDYSDEFFFKNILRTKIKDLNRGLARVTKMIGIEKHVTSHVARHSFADLARKHGANMYSIARGLRHSTISMTEKYLKTMDDEAVNELNEIYISMAGAGSNQNQSNDTDTTLTQI